MNTSTKRLRLSHALLIACGFTSTNCSNGENYNDAISSSAIVAITNNDLADTLFEYGENYPILDAKSVPAGLLIRAKGYNPKPKDGEQPKAFPPLSNNDVGFIKKTLQSFALTDLSVDTAQVAAVIVRRIPRNDEPKELTSLKDAVMLTNTHYFDDIGISMNTANNCAPDRGEGKLTGSVFLDAPIPLPFGKTLTMKNQQYHYEFPTQTSFEENESDNRLVVRFQNIAAVKAKPVISGLSALNLTVVAAKNVQFYDTLYAYVDDKGMPWWIGYGFIIVRVDKAIYTDLNRLHIDASIVPGIANAFMDVILQIEGKLVADITK